MGSKDMEAEEIQEALEESQMIEEMNYLMTDRKAELKGVEPVNGKDAYVVDIFNSKGEASTVYYDVASGNKVKVITTAEVPEMGKVTSISEFENYKSVNGYSFPFVQKISGAQNLTLNVETVEVNKKLSDDLFN